MNSEDPKAASGKWGDLLPRILSAVVMIIVGLSAILAGGIWFVALLVVCGAAMIWELVRMLTPRLATGGTTDWLILLVYGGAIVLACLTFISLRLAPQGLWLMTSLVAIVVTTDVMGYFAGRIIGGPKFWPRVSPKKTWSGTIAGWVGAVIVFFLLVWMYPSAAGRIPVPQIIGVAVALSLASQLGDIAESAIKRRCAIKDSSGLIPGHGGVMDRFDGMIGAGVAMSLLQVLLG